MALSGRKGSKRVKIFWQRKIVSLAFTISLLITYLMKIRDYIVLEHADFVVVNKPSGLLTIPDRAGKEPDVKGLLKEQFEAIFTVHRLDKDTSGLVVFARNEAVHKHLSQQFEQRETIKIYVGFVLGVLAERTGIIDQPIGEHPGKKGVMAVLKKGKPSSTEYEVLQDFKLFSWMQFRIHTGRTHQIRVHMKHLGHPIACDELYGDGKPIFISALKKNYNLSKIEDEERPMLSRLALHAAKLSFTDIQGQLHHIEAPLPKDMKALLNQLAKWKK